MAHTHTTVLLPLCYLPPVRYMAHWYAFGPGVEPRIRIERHEHYAKGTHRNRCHIAGANGPMCLSVPLLKGKHQGVPVSEVRMAYHEPWPVRHWQSIQSAYGKSPFFLHYADRLAPLFHTRPDTLFEWNLALLRALLRCLRLPDTLDFTEGYIPHPTNALDLRAAFPAHLPGTTTAHQHNPCPPYPQVFTDRHGFLPDLSVLDLLCCLGPEAGGYLRAWAGRGL